MHVTGKAVSRRIGEAEIRRKKRRAYYFTIRLKQRLVAAQKSLNFSQTTISLKSEEIFSTDKN